MITVITGCFLFIMNFSSNFGRMLLMIGVAIEIFSSYKFFTRKQVK